MSTSPRRGPQPYINVPNSPGGAPISPLNPRYHPQDQRGTYRQTGSSHGSSAEGNGSAHGHSSTTHGVASGQVGTSYGPYSGVDGGPSGMRPAWAQSRESVASETPTVDSYSKYNVDSDQPALLWELDKDPDIDDHLHNPSPHDALRDNRACTIWTARGWLNMGALLIITLTLVGLFVGYPVVAYVRSHPPSRNGGWNIGGINATGQVPDLPNMPSLIDSFTPQSALTRTGFDNNKYNLVFSDEFEVDGRTFWPGLVSCVAGMLHILC